jgi:hypothetical protein
MTPQSVKRGREKSRTNWKPKTIEALASWIEKDS